VKVFDMEIIYQKSLAMGAVEGISPEKERKGGRWLPLTSVLCWPDCI